MKWGIPTLTNKKNLIHLHHFPGMKRKLLNAFLTKPGLLNILYDLSPLDLEKNLYLKPVIAHQLHNYLSQNPIQPLLDSYQQHNIHIVTINEDIFPEQLKHIPDPPLILYYKGRTELWNASRMLSVVGSRKASPSAFPVMERVLNPLINESFTIVSGLALGIDGLAHKLALRSNTIGVLGSGLYHPYPASNRDLFEHMSKEHLVLSEYTPASRPEKWYFPERNRIISGLSRATLVIEAKSKSGSLITADQALEQGKDVFAIPGPISDPNFHGTNYLIQQGAKLIMNAEDILCEYN